MTVRITKSENDVGKRNNDQLTLHEDKLKKWISINLAVITS